MSTYFGPSCSTETELPVSRFLRDRAPRPTQLLSCPRLRELRFGQRSQVLSLPWSPEFAAEGVELLDGRGPRVTQDITRQLL